MSRTSALGQFTNLPVLADAADITAVGTTMADRIEKYVNMRFASTASRDAVITSPEEGMDAYIGSGDSAEGPYRHNGTSWRLPWNMPWGIQGIATKTADQTGITAEADVTSLSVTFTAVGNRRYKLSAFSRSAQVTNNSNQEFYITDSANVRQAYTQVVVNLSTNGYHNVFCVVSPSAGSITYKVRAAATAASMSIIASATGPATLLVEDIGPNGAPT